MSCKDCIHCSACMHTRTAALDPYQSRPFDKDTGECSDWLTTDVQEVKHGYWIAKDLDNFRKVECSCSICGWSGVETMIVMLIYTILNSAQIVAQRWTRRIINETLLYQRHSLRIRQ